jgi:hypothetical protein
VSELTTSTDMYILTACSASKNLGLCLSHDLFSTDRSFMHESHTLASAVDRDTARCSFQSHVVAAIYSFS